MKIAVIDGQGGRLGRLLIESLRERLGQRAWIIALGTNAIATSQMNKAPCDACATGESAISFNSPRVDVIAGSIGIIASGAMHGEVSPEIACSVAESDALKILIPFNKCNLRVMGVADDSMTACVTAAVDDIAALCENSAEQRGI